MRVKKAMGWICRVGKAHPTAAAALWSTMLAVGLTWPTVLHMSARVLGRMEADTAKHLWTLWWMRASVWDQGSFPLDTVLINFPAGMRLFPIEPLNGLAAVLLPFVPLVLLSNLLALANLAALGVAGAWLGRLVSRSVLGGILAGTLMECSSVAAYVMHIGVGELQHLWWLPLGLGVMEHARQTPKARTFALLGLCLAAATLSGFYIGLFLALSITWFALITLLGRGRSWKLAAGYALAAGLGLALTWPVVQAFAASWGPPDSISAIQILESMFLEGKVLPADGVAAQVDPSELLWANPRDGDLSQDSYQGGRYLGPAVMALALVGLVRAPLVGLAWAGLALLGVVFSMGSYLSLGGQEVLWEGTVRFRLPLLYLNWLLAWVAEPLHFAVRFLAITMTGLGVLGALAARGDGRSWRFVGVLATALVVVTTANGQRVARPWSFFELPDVSALEAIRGAPQVAVFNIFPDHSMDKRDMRLAMASQMAHGLPTQVVPIDRIREHNSYGMRLSRALKLPKHVHELTAPGRSLPVISEQDIQADFALLRDAGFGWIHFLHNPGAVDTHPQVKTFLNTHLGSPEITGDHFDLFRIPEVSISPARLDVLRTRLRQAIDDLLPQPGANRPAKFHPTGS